MVGGIIYHVVLCQILVGDVAGHSWSEHSADVDGHVEEAERSITLIGILGVVEQVTYKYLQVALEQTCTDGYKCQASEHGVHTYVVGCGWNGKSQIAEEHDNHTDGDTLSVTNLVGNHTSEER